ncbi:MAG: hypothetical protein DRN83_03260 [Hadesarchaea archaeon]|nr:MAG: hypothetical protein DRN83_03260 [Hadesarchaea archaeon]
MHHITEGRSTTIPALQATPENTEPQLGITRRNENKRTDNNQPQFVGFAEQQKSAPSINWVRFLLGAIKAYFGKRNWS